MAVADLGELPSDIICYDILPRLPAKSLMRFKSVCKLWSSLIGSPSFAAANYQKKQKTATNILFMYCTSYQLFLSSQIDDQQGSATHASQLPNIICGLRDPSVQTINGLVCAACRKGQIYVFNPTIRQSIKLPNPRDRRWSRYHFGFDPISNEYKVLRVVGCYDGELLLDIFTLNKKDSSWKELRVAVADLPFDPSELHFWTSTCINGTIYWEWMCKKKHIIVAFDIGDKKFRVISLPNDFTGRVDPTIGVAEVEGCLVVYDCHLNKGERFVLWILKDDVWVKETLLLLTYADNLCGGLDRGPNRCGGLHVGPLFTIHSGEVAIALHPYCHCLRKYTRPIFNLYNMKSKGCRRHEFVFPESLQLSTQDEEKRLPVAHKGNLRLEAGYYESIVPLVTNACD